MKYKIVMSFKLVLFFYLFVGIIIILDDRMTRKNESHYYPNDSALANFNQVVSACGRWLYALLPSEKSIVIIERKSGRLVKALALPFVPKSIQLELATNQLSIISVDGPKAGKLTLEIRDLHLID